MTRQSTHRSEARTRLQFQRDLLIERLEAERQDEDQLLRVRAPELLEMAGRDRLAELVDRFCERDRLALTQVDAALRRVQEGDYGICTDCGERIPTDRLLVVPEAERCEQCQELEESILVM